MIHLGLNLARAGDTKSSLPPTTREDSLDSDILMVLDRVEPTGTIAMSYLRRERELLELFERLTADECLALAHRLSVCRADDTVAVGFGRMVPERRQRIVRFLADVRRREALKGARRW
ncbi:MAG: hypothetical protein ABI467_07610 [Kofleriaceae bacterium]